MSRKCKAVTLPVEPGLFGNINRNGGIVKNGLAGFHLLYLKRKGVPQKGRCYSCGAGLAGGWPVGAAVVPRLGAPVEARPCARARGRLEGVGVCSVEDLKGVLSEERGVEFKL